MWVGSMTLEYVNYILWALEYSMNIRSLFIHLGLTWKFGRSYALNTMHGNH